MHKLQKHLKVWKSRRDVIASQEFKNHEAGMFSQHSNHSLACFAKCFKLKKDKKFAIFVLPCTLNQKRKEKKKKKVQEMECFSNNH